MCVCISVCEGMGVCLPVRGPVSGRVGLCWDSQLLRGAVPGRAAGLVSVYWQSVCVSVCVYLCINVRLGVSPLLLGHSFSSLAALYSGQLISNVIGRFKW